MFDSLWSSFRQYLVQRSTPFILLILFLVLLMIPFRVLMYGYMPPDDALRHVAKVVSEKAWPEILVMNETFSGQDHNEGWHRLLGGLQQLGADKSTLLEFSMIGLFLMFMLSGLIIFRATPEAWGAAVLLASLCRPFIRMFYGRPLLFTAAILLIQLAIWSRVRPMNRKWFGVSVALFAAASYIHGGYYLWAILPLAVLLSGRIKCSFLVGGAWLAGSVIAGILTGDPVMFLFLQVKQALSSAESATRYTQLVSEFQPYYDFFSIMAVAMVGLMLAIRGGLGPALKSIAFWVMVLGVILGMKNGRFWFDWGRVAMLFWVAESLQAMIRSIPEAQQPRRVLVATLLGAALWLNFTGDVRGRWSNPGRVDVLSLNDPEHVEWLPEAGGIFYSDSMTFFYRTFFENPHGDWRYILGFEAILMPKEDLDVYRELRSYDPKPPDMLYQPWVTKMAPADRLILRRRGPVQPDLPDLEWKYVAKDTWSGRLAREVAIPGDL